MIRLGIGCDHAAYEEKEFLMEYATNRDIG